MTLENQVALVSGAARGIGKATALALARNGAHVAAVDVDQAGAEETAGMISALGRKALAMVVDVGDLDSIDRMTRRVVAELGGIDILVNNAGVTRRAYIMDLTEEDWDRIMRVNGKGVFFCLQRVAREMIPRRRGVIINIASIAGKGYAGTSNAIYAASKGAVISLTRIAACSSRSTTSTSMRSAPARRRRRSRRRTSRARAATEDSPWRRWNVAGTRRFRSGGPTTPRTSPSSRSSSRRRARGNITGQSCNVDGGLIFD